MHTPLRPLHASVAKLVLHFDAFGALVTTCTQLWYFEDRTPAGWQPKHFREADPAELKFSKGRDDEEIDSKLKIKIGDLTTPHHTLSVRRSCDSPTQQAVAARPPMLEAVGSVPCFLAPCETKALLLLCSPIWLYPPGS